MRLPSIGLTAQEFARFFRWLKLPDGPEPVTSQYPMTYEPVDWEHATAEEMEEWRQMFARYQKMAAERTT